VFKYALIFVLSFKWGIALSIYFSHHLRMPCSCTIQTPAPPMRPPGLQPKTLSPTIQASHTHNGAPAANRPRPVRKGLPNTISAVSAHRFDSAHELQTRGKSRCRADCAVCVELGGGDKWSMRVLVTSSPAPIPSPPAAKDEDNQATSGLAWPSWC
jgi:hypothetical protein